MMYCYYEMQCVLLEITKQNVCVNKLCPYKTYTQYSKINITSKFYIYTLHATNIYYILKEKSFI